MVRAKSKIIFEIPFNSVNKWQLVITLSRIAVSSSRERKVSMKTRRFTEQAATTNFRLNMSHIAPQLFNSQNESNTQDRNEICCDISNGPLKDKPEQRRHTENLKYSNLKTILNFPTGNQKGFTGDIKYCVMIKGAPERVLKLCSTFLNEKGQEMTIDINFFNHFQQVCKSRGGRDR